MTTKRAWGLGSAAGLARWAAEAVAQPTEEYRPLVEPLRAMPSGCLEQSHDADSAVACDRLTSEACLAMGPGGGAT